MRVIITGGTGYIGQQLAEALKGSYEVIVLSRSPATHALPGIQILGWDGQTPQGWGTLADGAFAIINLAGENIGARLWTAAHKKAVLESRVNAGQAVTAAIQAAAVKPQVLVQASAVGFYGNAPQAVDENSPAGNDFLANVCVQWEASTAAVEALGVRRVVIRTGIVIDPKDKALQRMIIPFKLFAGGPLGNGRQPFPWIHPADEIGAIRFLMEHESCRGVYNLTGPQGVTNAEFARSLGKVMGRPSFMPAPGFALRLMLGEMSIIVLEGQNAKSNKLQAAGYPFKFSGVERALRDVLR